MALTELNPQRKEEAPDGEDPRGEMEAEESHPLGAASALSESISREIHQCRGHGERPAEINVPVQDKSFKIIVYM